MFLLHWIGPRPIKSISCNVHLLSVTSWKPCFLVECRLLVKEHIANISKLEDGSCPKRFKQLVFSLLFCVIWIFVNKIQAYNKHRVLHIGFTAPILFRYIKQLVAAEMRCSPPHDFRHGGLNSPMPGACGLHRGVAGHAGENKVCRLGSSVMYNNSRRIKL